MNNEGGSLESEGKITEAIAAYEKELKSDPANEKALTRLMIIYHRQKDLKNELKYINQLIKTNHEHYKHKQKNAGAVTSLSNKINRALGRTDKHGKLLVLPDEIKKLEKRRDKVAEKLKTGKAS